MPEAATRFEVDAVLFDSDGVLVDSHEAVNLAWRRLAQELGLGDDPVDSALSGMRPVDALSRILPAKVATRAVARLEEIELDLAPSTRAIPGAKELAARLPGDRWTIVTSASRTLALARWRSAGVPMPAVAVTADDVSRGKPHPEPYQTAARLLGTVPNRCLVFEDSPSGGEAARAAGAAVVAVGDRPWGFEPALRIPDLTRAPDVAVRR